MKNSTGQLMAKLIAAIPLAAFSRKRTEFKKSRQNQHKRVHAGRENTLNRIFMVRYRIEHSAF
jgi:hypothetical protein